MPTEISGFPTFNAQIGGSSAIGTSEIVASVNTTAVGTISNTNETDLMTYVLPANTLNANNIGVRIRGWFSSLAAANNQTMRFYFGASTFTIGPGAWGTTQIYWDIVVVRTSSNNQTASGTYNVSGVATGVLNASPSQTDSSAITIKFTGTNGVATVDGVKQLGMVVEVINLPGGGAVPNPYLPASLNQSTAGQVLAPTGTAGAPSYSFSSATGYGIYLASGVALSHGSGIVAVTAPGTLTAQMGTSGNFAPIPGVANVNVTAVGTIANTSETDLITYSLPANSLSANGKGVRITAWGTTLAAANNQVIKMYFGSTAIYTQGAMAWGNNTWRMVGTVVRTSSNNQAATAEIMGGTAAWGQLGSTPAQTDTAAITIKCTGQNGVSTVDGVKQLGLIVEMIN